MCRATSWDGRVEARRTCDEVMARVEILEEHDGEPGNGKPVRRREFSVGSVADAWFSVVDRLNNDQTPSLAFRKEGGRLKKVQLVEH